MCQDKEIDAVEPEPPVEEKPKGLSVQELFDLLTPEYGDGEGYTPE